MKIVKYKKNDQVLELEADSLSTNLILNGKELFENDLVTWETVSLTDKEPIYFLCKVMWSNYFNGWALIRVDISDDLEIPIGDSGIPLTELNIY